MGRQSLKWPFLVIKQVSRTRTRLHIIEFFFFCQRSFMEFPKQPRLLTRQQISFHKLTSSILHCRQHTHNTLNMERLSCCLFEPSPLFSSGFGTENYFEVYQKRNIHTNLVIKLLIYNAILPAKCARARVTQSLRE